MRDSKDWSPENMTLIVPVKKEKKVDKEKEDFNDGPEDTNKTESEQPTGDGGNSTSEEQPNANSTKEEKKEDL